MIKFYYSGAPNPMKVALMLEETGLPYEPVPVDTRKGDQHKPEFLAINPNAKVPAIVDGDVTVFDSNAILLYLAEKTGKFLPANTPTAARRTAVVADVRRFRHRAVLRAVGALPPIRAGEESYALNRYAYEAQRHFGILDARLAKQQYMVGDGYSIVDMAVWGWSRLVPNVLGEEAWAKFPNLKRLVDEISRPAGGGARQRAQGQAQVQDRVRRGSQARHVQAPGSAGSVIDRTKK